LALSVWALMQSAPHIVLGDGQVEAHEPDAQTLPIGHAAPHMPQFARSLSRLMHVPLQDVRPDGHVGPVSPLGGASTPGTSIGGTTRSVTSGCTFPPTAQATATTETSASTAAERGGAVRFVRRLMAMRLSARRTSIDRRAAAPYHASHRVVT